MWWIMTRASDGYVRILAGLALGCGLVVAVHGSPPEDVVTRQAIIRQLAVPRDEHKGLVKVEEPAPSIEFRNIHFGLGSSDLTGAAREQLDELGAALASAELRDFRFEVVGHTDARGSREYNQALSERRAAAVRDYLVRTAGADPRKLEAIGRGMDALSHPHDPLAAENRRVEIRNLGGER